MKHIFSLKHSLYLSLLLTVASFLMGGFSAGTLVLTPQGLVPIASLHEGDFVIGYDTQHLSIASVPVQKIAIHRSQEIWCITTPYEKLLVSASQPFFNATTQQFQQAQDLQAGSLLETLSGEACECLNIYKVEGTLPLYEVVLLSPHIFFISTSHVMSHNLAALGETISLTQWILGGTVIACLSAGKMEKIFPSYEHAKQYVISQILQFANEFSGKGNVKRIPNPTPVNLASVYNANTPQNVYGIIPPLSIWHDVCRYPTLYGPLCWLASMKRNGCVECLLYIFRFDSHRPQLNLFRWELLGTGEFSRKDSLVENFIKAEDAKAIDNIKAFIKTWPLEVRRHLVKCKTTSVEDRIRQGGSNRCFEQEILGITFGPQAL